MINQTVLIFFLLYIGITEMDQIYCPLHLHTHNHPEEPGVYKIEFV